MLNKYIFPILFCLLGCVQEDRVTIDSKSIYVIDGDTIAINEKRYRLMGFDTPETYRAKCASEKALGSKATMRLRDLIYSNQFVELVFETHNDKYGRGLARLYVQKIDVARTLIDEGLARSYNGGQRSDWC